MTTSRSSFFIASTISRPRVWLFGGTNGTLVYGNYIGTDASGMLDRGNLGDVVRVKDGYARNFLIPTGQARRAEAIRQAMAHWRRFRPSPYDASKGIQLGALVCLVDSDDKQQQLFLGPDGGSMKLVSGAQLVQVISSEAPLGRAMLGQCEGDEVSLQLASTRQQLEVLRVH